MVFGGFEILDDGDKGFLLFNIFYGVFGGTWLEGFFSNMPKYFLKKHSMNELDGYDEMTKDAISETEFRKVSLFQNNLFTKKKEKRELSMEFVSRDKIRDKNELILPTFVDLMGKKQRSSFNASIISDWSKSSLIIRNNEHYNSLS